MSSLLESLNSDLATVADSVLPGLVRVNAGPRGRGAGVIIREDGLIVTNRHVAEFGPRGRRHRRGSRGRRWQTGDDHRHTHGHHWHHHGPHGHHHSGHEGKRWDLSVTLNNGERVPAELIATSDDHDLALLKVTAPGLAAVRLGDSTALKAGQWVTAYGFPWGVPGAMTHGVVIGSGDHLPENPMPGREWIAVSLHYRPGHSGGPLVDAAGHLVGINTIMAGPEVGLAVPVHLVQALVAGLKEPEAAV